MKTKHILLAMIFISYVSLQAQSSSSSKYNDPWNGIQNSVNNLFTDTKLSPELEKLLWWAMIQNGDIIMWMNATYGDEAHIKLKGGMPIGHFTTASNKEIYGEFDWDNKALSLRSKSDESFSSLHIGAIPILGRKNPAEEITQYTDKDGYWYVPYNPEKEGDWQGPEQNIKYLKFNAKKFAASAMEGYIDLYDDLHMENIGYAIYYLLENFDWEALGFDFEEEWAEDNAVYLMKLFQEFNGELTAEMKEIIKQLLDKELAHKIGFPVFIHWAFMYRPDVIRKKFEVDEKQFYCYDSMPDHLCTKLTVKSGPEKGKFMIFDKFNRLVYIDAGKEGTVEYAYDLDLTVNLPPAYNMADIMETYMPKSKD